MELVIPHLCQCVVVWSGVRGAPTAAVGLSMASAFSRLACATPSPLHNQYMGICISKSTTSHPIVICRASCHLPDITAPCWPSLHMHPLNCLCVHHQQSPMFVALLRAPCLVVQVCTASGFPLHPLLQCSHTRGLLSFPILAARLHLMLPTLHPPSRSVPKHHIRMSALPHR